ncbi:MAG TPA: hypothetical protein VMU26_01635 [Candidatus Polarisedimenticolia bacterium]|nr:hypothetical protein [Candidatus Polarisedimenticolia bacterium]
MRDVTIHRAALNRDMPYRVVLPVSVVAGQKLPVVYVLHGGGGGFRDCSNSDVAQFAERGLISRRAGRELVLLHKLRRSTPGALRGFYSGCSDRRCCAQVSAAAGRAIAAPSRAAMGGFGAVK